MKDDFLKIWRCRWRLLKPLRWLETNSAKYEVYPSGSLSMRAAGFFLASNARGKDCEIGFSLDLPVWGPGPAIMISMDKEVIENLGRQILAASREGFWGGDQC